MAANSTRKKPFKPHPDFPLTANGNGQWSKKIRGRVYYFGRWAEPNAALGRYLDQKDDLLAGRRPKEGSDDLRIRELLNRFLPSKKLQVEAGELKQRSRDDYFQSWRTARTGARLRPGCGRLELRRF